MTQQETSKYIAYLLRHHPEAAGLHKNIRSDTRDFSHERRPYILMKKDSQFQMMFTGMLTSELTHRLSLRLSG